MTETPQRESNTQQPTSAMDSSYDLDTPARVTPPEIERVPVPIRNESDIEEENETIKTRARAKKNPSQKKVLNSSRS